MNTGITRLGALHKQIDKVWAEWNKWIQANDKRSIPPALNDAMLELSILRINQAKSFKRITRKG